MQDDIVKEWGKMRFVLVADDVEDIKRTTRELMAAKMPDASEDEIQLAIAEMLRPDTWGGGYVDEDGVEQMYQVASYEVPCIADNSMMPDIIHLSIKRRDREPVADWRVMQAIKNCLVGPECEAVELYPAESRKVDGANQYHLWCLDSSESRFPFGFTERQVSYDEVGGTKQRPATV